MGVGKSGLLGDLLNDSVSKLRDLGGNRSSELFGPSESNAQVSQSVVLDGRTRNDTSAFTLPQIKPNREGVLKGF